MVIHRLVHLLPPDYQARLPQLTRVGRRFGGGLTEKPWENSNLLGILKVGRFWRYGAAAPNGWINLGLQTNCQPRRTVTSL